MATKKTATKKIATKRETKSEASEASESAETKKAEKADETRARRSEAKTRTGLASLLTHAGAQERASAVKRYQAPKPATRAEQERTALDRFNAFASGIRPSK